MNHAKFRQYIRDKDDPRVRGIASHDAYSWADHVCAMPGVRDLFDKWRAIYQTTAYKGISTDGNVDPSLFELRDEGAPVEAMCVAAQNLLSRLDDREREKLCFALNAKERHAWMNPEVYMHRFGLRLQEVSADIRDSMLNVLKATLSTSGYERVRELMRLNHFLGELVGGNGVLNEFSYNLLLFGTPSRTEPWGWSFYGHHVCLNVLVVGPQIVLAPVFMGAEPDWFDEGPYAGVSVFDQEENLALDMMRGLPPDLFRQAQRYARKRDPAMPAGRIVRGDELILAGAFQDNRIVPTEGAPVASFGASNRRALLDLVSVYCDHLPEGPRRARLDEIERHLDRTHFCWIGGTDDESPFYYRIQSPVVLIEFDHHAGVFLGNTEPEKFHIHTMMRVPNGNDYGMALIRHHCERLQARLHAKRCDCGSEPANPKHDRT